MDDRIRQGRLDRWNDDRGFGFIRDTTDKRDIFVHITAFRKHWSRRPGVGDRVSYQLHADSSGNLRAVNARIRAALSLPRESRSLRRRPLPGRRRGGLEVWLFRGMALLACLVLVLFLRQRIPRLMSLVVVSPQVATAPGPPGPSFSCRGKIYCSQMASCEEARFYLRHCPGTMMDGDGDGIPCESQWCSH